MDLTPQDIQEKRFHDSFRGYSHEEVDVFLDSVADSYERVYREAQDLKQRIKKLEARLVEAEGTEAMLKRTLLAAQKTADEAVSDAKSQSQQMIDGAGAKAEGIVKAAESKAAKIVSDAEELMKDARGKLDQLRGFVGSYQRDFRSFVQNQLHSLDDMPAPPGAPGPTSTPDRTPVPKPKTQPQQPQTPQGEDLKIKVSPPPPQTASKSPSGAQPASNTKIPTPPAPIAKTHEENDAAGPPDQEGAEKPPPPKIVTRRTEAKPPQEEVAVTAASVQVDLPDQDSGETSEVSAPKPKPHGAPPALSDEPEDDADKAITELFWGED